MNRPWAPIPTTTLILQSQITNQNMMYNWKKMGWTWILSRTRTLDKMHPQHKILKSRWSYPSGERFGQGFQHPRRRRSSNICIQSQAKPDQQHQLCDQLWSPSQLTKSIGLLPQTSAIFIIDDQWSSMITIATDQKNRPPSPDIGETSGDNAANHQPYEVQAAAQPNLWKRIEVIKTWSW